MIQPEPLTINPIPTTYNGYQVRSRLEGRWLVFLDALGIPWEYEREGYQLGDCWYIPDLYLPSVGWWVEIKPESATDADCRKASVFADVGQQNVLVLMGHPTIRAEEQVSHQWILEVGYRTEAFIGAHAKIPRSWWLDFVRGRTALKELHEFLTMRTTEGLWLHEPVPEYDETETAARALYELDRRYYRNRYGREHPARTGCGSTCRDMGWGWRFLGDDEKSGAGWVPDWAPGGSHDAEVRDAFRAAERFRFW